QRGYADHCREHFSPRCHHHEHLYDGCSIHWSLGCHSDYWGIPRAGAEFNIARYLGILWHHGSVYRCGLIFGGSVMALLSLIQTGGGSGSSSSIWNHLQNATGNLTLSNTGFSTTFDQTSAVAWTWANTTAATSSTTPPGFVVSATATAHVNSGVSAAVNTIGA